MTALINIKQPAKICAWPTVEDMVAFQAHCQRTAKVKALALNGATAGERSAACAILDRIEPAWRMTDVELLTELGAL